MNNYDVMMMKSEDIYKLMKILTNIGWKSVRETSINRIIYLSAVLYSFRYPDESNIFKEDYIFTITLSGPEDPDIENALVNLESNDVIAQSEEGYKVSGNVSFSFKAKQDLRKTEWFEDIAYIVGIYGEDKIYDFIFRDPEYREALQGNSIYNLNIGEDNTTVKFLNSFKMAFEEKLYNKEYALDNRKYLELYFEYIFGKILRGEK